MYSTKYDILLRARRILEKVTPIDSNCGALCDAHCCRGASANPESCGAMWLFPGEASFYNETSRGLTVKSAHGNEGYPFLLCSNEGGEGCVREDRPIACRIFPLFPMAVRSPRTGKYRIVVTADPRGVRHCPLLREGSPEMTPEFRRTVRQVGKLMLREPELRKYLIATSEYLMGLAKLL